MLDHAEHADDDDRVTFVSRPQLGTVVHLEKQLVWHPDSAIRRLTGGRTSTRHGPWSQDETLADAPA